MLELPGSKRIDFCVLNASLVTGLCGVDELVSRAWGTRISCYFLNLQGIIFVERNQYQEGDLNIIEFMFMRFSKSQIVSKMTSVIAVASQR